MGKISSAAEKIMRDFYRDQAIDEHEARKASWGWFGRSQHWMFVSWRCPACKAANSRRANNRKEASRG